MSSLSSPLRTPRGATENRGIFSIMGAAANARVGSGVIASPQGRADRYATADRDAASALQSRRHRAAQPLRGLLPACIGAMHNRLKFNPYPKPDRGRLATSVNGVQVTLPGAPAIRLQRGEAGKRASL